MAFAKRVVLTSEGIEEQEDDFPNVPGLTPCPFCGEKVRLRMDTFQPNDFTYASVVYCYCGAEGPISVKFTKEKSHDEGIKVWDKRANVLLEKDETTGYIPCPFCGDEAIYMYSATKPRARCANCRCFGPPIQSKKIEGINLADRMRIAIKLFNTRAEIKPLPKRRKKV